MDLPLGKVTHMLGKVTHGLGKNYFDQCRGWVNKKNYSVFRLSSVTTHAGINNERSLNLIARNFKIINLIINSCRIILQCIQQILQ
jgi:hypothetical protein